MDSKAQHLNYSQKKPNKGVSILAAAALQDHLTRKYQLSSSVSAGPMKQRPKNAAPSHKPRKMAEPSIKANTRNNNEVEYSLDKAPPPLTLAQRLGLVEAPPRLLEENVWTNIKAASNVRQDSSQPCPICQEDFGLSTQVLLSCSHVFHLACLSAFERFSRAKRCPLCRREDYQKRVIYEGAHQCRHVAATKIQSCWRGHVVRCWYRKYRDLVPPTHPQLRTRHFQKKLTSMTDKMVELCETNHRQAAHVLAEADSSISQMKKAFAALDIATSTSTEVSWDEVRSKADGHITGDCSVCLMPLLSESKMTDRTMELSPTSVKDVTGTRTFSVHPSRPLSLLSCGHILHQTCIEALERFSCSSPAISATVHMYQCPLCRTQYSRTSL